jgi:hypothetical protein
MVLALLEGKETGNPEGVIKEAVSMKKIKRRKIISVMELMLKAESTLCLDLKFMIIWALEEDQ